MPRLGPLRLALLPTAALAAFSFIPWARENPRLVYSILGAAAALVVLFVLTAVRTASRTLRVQVAPRPVHYVQLAMHSSIYIYWGYYWREVYHYAPLIVAQIAFFYALDMLVTWWRQDEWILGLGPFPIVLSTNLFLWFRDDWFYLQFLMIATAVVCKQFVTWKRGGRRVHVFNPSAIALAVFSLFLLATHSTQISWAEEVAVSLGRPPYIYLWIFATGMVVQSLFAVTLVTLSAAAALFALNLAYTAATGVYYFVDSTIPIAVFLGLHLLVTDPATSPRSNWGKVIFGALYGTAVFALYSVLGWLGMPTFYDKLLCVPPLNLTVRVLDNIRGPQWLTAGWSPRRLNFAHMAIWIALFAGFYTAGLLGGHHPGATSAFWKRACEEQRSGACATWVRTRDIACTHGSGPACLQLGLALDEGITVPRDARAAVKNLARGCDLKAGGACSALVSLVRKEGPDVLRTPCTSGDGESCFVLGSLYYSGAGVPRDLAQSAALFRQSCDGNWPRGCGGLAEMQPRGSAEAIANFERACRAGVAASCTAAAAIYRERNDLALASARGRQALELSARAANENAVYFLQ